MTVEPSQQRTGRRGAIVAGIALIVALGAGLLIGYLMFNDDEPDATSDNAADAATANVEHACALTERLGETYTSVDDFDVDKGFAVDEGEAWPWEATAVAYLLRTAGMQDSGFEDLIELGDKIITDMSSQDFEAWLADTEQVREECDAR